MAIPVRLLASGGEEEFHHHPGPDTGEPVLIFMSPAQAHGHFKTATLTTANTVIVVQPKPGKSIWITDILVSGEKQAGSDATIQFTDGVNTEVIFISNQVDVPPAVSVGLQSYLKGWKDARVELVTSGAGDATVTIGYLHSAENLSFAQWDAER